METYGGLTADEQERAQGNLFLGLVMNEYLEEFARGDFLIRNLLGADPQVGSIAVGALPRTGQTVQFQRRDPESASEDLRAALEGAVEGVGEGKVLGGCLCSCNGRGQRMFGTAGHDAGMVQSELGVPGLAGFFCSGELGPVGGRNFLHGFTASLALFVSDGAGEVCGE
jgi:small ligand-binding sensory domain FIST